MTSLKNRLLSSTVLPIMIGFGMVSTATVAPTPVMAACAANPCAAKSPCNPCAAKSPCAASN